MTRRRSRGKAPEAHAEAPPSWRRIDLHLHTPGSGDYQEPRASYLELLQRAEARGLDIIAFTDHNSVAGYAAMSREIEQLTFLEAGERLLPDEARRLQEYRRLTERILVLPGFEFTATFGFHILGIFPPETTVRKLEHLLLELNIPEEKLDQGASEVGATTDVLRAYEIIADAGGLVIGAHVNSTHGIAMIGLGFGGQTKIAYTQDPNLHALEVTDLESVSRRATSRFFNGSKPEYPRRMHCIQGSDAHRVTRDPQRPEKNLGIGDRCTEVLLPEVSFEALKTLFASTDFSRTRPARAPEEHPFDPLTSAREEGATIVQAFHDLTGSNQERAKAILRDVVAFANTNGGVIYVGVSADPREPIRGVDGAAELAELLRFEAERQIVPPLIPDLETLTSGGKTVLVVTVQKGTETPYTLDPGSIYVRQEGETTLALRDEIVQLVRAALAPQTVGLDPGSALPPRVAPTWEQTPDEQPEQPAPLQAQPATAAAPRDAQQAAVQQATAAERERQQERTPVPRTGVEIIASTERNGLTYHTVRDLRNRRVVRNVTRESARRLWRYAILQVEQQIIEPSEIRWDERDGRFGFWKGYRQPEGMRRYNLIYREPATQRGPNEQGERLRIFFGVTEDGIDERWRAVLPPDSALPVLYYDDDLPATAPIPAPATDTAPVPDTALEQSADIAVPVDVAEIAAPLAVDPVTLPQAAPAPPPASASQHPGAASELTTYSVDPASEAPDELDSLIWGALPTADPSLAPAAGLPAPETPEVAAEGEAAPKRRSRSRGGRRTPKAAGAEAATPEERAPEAVDVTTAAEPVPPPPIATPASPPVAVEHATASESPAVPADQSAPADVAAEAPAPKRRRAPRRPKAAATPAPTDSPARAPLDVAAGSPPSAASVPAQPVDAPPQPVPPVEGEASVAPKPKRRRAPRKPKPVAEDAPVNEAE